MASACQCRFRVELEKMEKTRVWGFRERRRQKAGDGNSRESDATIFRSGNTWAKALMW